MSHSGSLFGGILLNTTAYHNNNNSLIDVFDAGRMFGNNNNNMSMPGHNNNNNNNSMFMSTVVNNNSNNNNSMFEVVEPVSRAKMLILGMTLKQIHDAILLMLLLFVMFSMGCGVTLRQVSVDFPTSGGSFSLSDFRRLMLCLFVVSTYTHTHRSSTICVVPRPCCCVCSPNSSWCR